MGVRGTRVFRVRALGRLSAAPKVWVGEAGGDRAPPLIPTDTRVRRLCPRVTRRNRVWTRGGKGSCGFGSLLCGGPRSPGVAEGSRRTVRLEAGLTSCGRGFRPPHGHVVLEAVAPAWFYPSAPQCPPPPGPRGASLCSSRSPHAVRRSQEEPLAAATATCPRTSRQRAPSPGRGWGVPAPWDTSGAMVGRLRGGVACPSLLSLTLCSLLGPPLPALPSPISASLTGSLSDI